MAKIALFISLAGLFYFTGMAIGTAVNHALNGGKFARFLIAVSCMLAFAIVCMLIGRTIFIGG